MISIVIPSMNRSSLYDRTLPSVIDLTFTHNVEILVVFDGDITKDTRRHQLENKSVKVLTTGGLGGLKARLFGARHAKYKKILFLDDDDELVYDDSLNEIHAICESEFSILSVNILWSEHTFIQWYISKFKFRKQAIDAHYVPATFSGMVLDRSFLIDIPEEIAIANTFQDVLVYNYAISKGVIPTMHSTAINFHQDFRSKRNSQDVQNRALQAKKLLKLDRINKEQYDKIAMSILFTSLRQFCWQGNMHTIKFLDRKFFSSLNLTTIFKIMLRAIFELPVLVALLVDRLK